MAFIYDIIIILILAFFAWRGAKKGLILSLCALVGIVVAFFGARFVSSEFYAPVADILEPPIYQSILGVDKDTEEKAALNGVDTYSMEELMKSIRETDLFTGVMDFLEDAVRDDIVQGDGENSAAKAVSAYLAKLAAKAVLFAVTFLLIVLVWFLLSHLLDLTFKLPGLALLNGAGGLVLGLAKAALLIVVLVWIGQLLGKIPSPPETPIVSLFTPEKIFSLLNSLIV